MRLGESAATPWVITVAEQRRHPGVPRRVRVAAPLAELGLSSAAVTEGADVEVDVELEALSDGRIVVTGTIDAPWTGECRRCLEPVSDTLTADIQEVFEIAPDDGAETYPLAGDHLDLEPMVRDAVLLALPLAPLCRSGCAGPDPDEHPVSVEGEQPVDDRPIDPRWAALADIDLGDP